MNRSQHIRLVSACLSALVVASVAAGIVPAPAHAADATTWATDTSDIGIQAIPTFHVSGTGWGHGIGMSQYGARGSALAGKSYEWILGHYYTGTTLGTRASVSAKVNIDCAYRDASYPGRPYWTIKSVGSSLRVWRTTTYDPTVTLPADTWYRFWNDGTNVIVKTEAGVEVARFDYDVWVAPGGAPGLLQVAEKSTSTDGAYHALTADGWPTDGFYDVRYRGQIWLDRIGTRLAAVNQLPMEQYLYGVVPREMPASWGDDTPAALKAQATAARSYAYSGVQSNKILTCTTWDQVYKGHSRISSGEVEMHEDSRSNAAVDATAGQYVLSSGQVATGYFFSQSGGYTANNEDVWLSGDPVPYLRAVPDAYEYLAAPPYSPWPTEKEKTFSGLEIADRLRGLQDVPPSPTHVTGVVFDRAVSGHVRYATFTFSNGAKATISGDTVRSKLGLMSTVFYFTGFPIERISGSDRYATAVAVADEAFESTTAAVVVASGEDFADALTGSGLAGVLEAPLLLTRAASLPSSTASALAEFAPATVYVMGGQVAVNAATASAIKSVVPTATIVRVGGADRYETAAQAAELIVREAPGSMAIIANGHAWPDAASASALAYAEKAPILLTPPDALGDDAAAYLERYAPAMTLLVGGTAVLSEQIATDVKTTSGMAPVRLAGATRYDTAAAVARYTIAPAVGFTYDEVYLATGEVYADALTGGTLAGRVRKPLLLMQPDSCPAGTAAFLTEHKTAIGQIYLFGGPAAISEDGRAALDTVMMR